MCGALPWLRSELLSPNPALTHPRVTCGTTVIATRREVLSPDEPGGLPVAVRSDAFLVHKTSERVTGVMDSEADVIRAAERRSWSMAQEAASLSSRPRVAMMVCLTRFPSRGFRDLKISISADFLDADDTCGVSIIDTT